MEKRGVVEPGRTPPTEPQQQRPGEKRAGKQAQTESLDDDFTKRAADSAADAMKKTGS